MAAQQKELSLYDLGREIADEGGWRLSINGGKLLSDHNNRLFHWMGPKKVLWIHERDLKMYRDPTSFKVPEEGVEFLVQHHIHGNWVHGVFIREKDQWNDRITIKWTPVIVVKS